MSKVFVYGSLRRGRGNHVLLEGAEFIGEAVTEPEYTMVSLGGFPGVIEEGETAIVGEIYEVDQKTEARLDALEGVRRFDPESGLYRRSTAVLPDGQEVLIYIYNHHRPIDRYAVVESGDWNEWVEKEERSYRHVKR